MKDRSSRIHHGLIASAVVLPPIGAVLILLAYHVAAGLAEPGSAQFALFWAGFLLGMLPLAALACTGGINGATRAAALVGIGLFGTIPRLLRTSPAGSDEFTHLRQSIEAFFAGEVGHVSYLLPITKEFPGLHQVASAIARLTGLSLWHSGLAVVIAAHVLSVLAVYQLIRAVGVPARGAGAGAVIYTLNPSWLLFNATFSYESLALPILLWCLAATIAACRATDKPAVRSLAAAVLCVVALPVIHHLTTLFLALILILLITALVTQRLWLLIAGRTGEQRGRIWPMLLVAYCLAMSVMYWWSGNFGWLMSYLSPAWTRGFAQIKAILDGAVLSSGGRRGLFSGAPNPAYEIVSGYLYPVITLVLFLLSLAVLWHRRRQIGPAIWAFAVLASLYFLSMPMVLTKGGAEGAHRSWAFSFIGIAVLCGVAWSFSPGLRDVIAARGTRPRWLANAFDHRRVRVGAAALVFTFLAIGGVVLGTPVSGRFPGSANVGDDTRSVSKEGGAVAAWLAANTPIDTPVLADRYVSHQVGSVGRMASLRPSATFPIWDLYMRAEPVTPEVLKQILGAKIRYFVVDARMATTRPRLGYWFTKDEPGADGNLVFPQSAIDRFDCLPWLQGVYGAGPLTVYQVNRVVLQRTMAGSCQGWVT
ncbi:MAG: hypothetical protein WBB07_12630 [Mycobacterium sp.]